MRPGLKRELIVIMLMWSGLLISIIAMYALFAVFAGAFWLFDALDERMFRTLVTSLMFGKAFAVVYVAAVYIFNMKDARRMREFVIENLDSFKW